MEERNMPRRPRREKADDQPRNESLVYGKNPVTELLKSGSGVDTVLLAEGMAPAVAAYYTAMAKEAGATVKRVHPNKLRLMTGTESHQGVAAFASEIEYATVEDLLAAAKEKGEPPFLVLSDGIEDPHNLGAVMRSALLCGAHGIVIPKRGAASGAAITRVDERERSQTVLANKRTGALAAGTSCWRQCLERLVCHPLGKR